MRGHAASRPCRRFARSGQEPLSIRRDAIAEILPGAAVRDGPWFRRIVEGEPRLLVRDGRMLSRALHDAQVRPEELRAAVRNAGLVSVDDVRLAVLETDGSISIIPMNRSGQDGDSGR